MSTREELVGFLRGMSWEQYLRLNLNLDRPEGGNPLNFFQAKVDPSFTAAAEGGQVMTRSNCSRYAIPDAFLFPSWQQFQGRVSSLPPEICRIILDMVLDETFGPRTVHTHIDPPVTRVFLALNRRLYNEYKRIYWSENTWVIGPGNVNDSMRFMSLPPFDTEIAEYSRQVPNQAAFGIKRVTLRLSQEDLVHPATIHRSFVRSDAPCNPTFTISSFQLLEERRSECKAFAEEIMQIWQDKMDRIAFLDLQHLTLDCTHAYTPDGRFLGVDAVQRIMPFVHRIPEDLRIVAPSRRFEKEIRNVIEAINDPGPIDAKIWSVES